MKFNTPLPQSLPKECLKAAKIFKSFVDSGNNGLDGVIPRTILENARGFAIFTIFKAGFLFSARAGSGIAIAKLDDGTWSAPSAIGTAGLGVGGQAGAEMTDFLIVLNSHSAVRSFMTAGSLTLGGNMSIAVGPLGRNGEAIGSLNSKGKVSAMYSYSKTRGLFGGVSIEGSVIVERQDANAQAYRSDVSAKMLLSGAISPPEWASPLIKTLEACTGMPGSRQWVQEAHSQHNGGYLFDGVESPHSERAPSAIARLKKRDRSSSSPFPPASWGDRKQSGSYFEDAAEEDAVYSRKERSWDAAPSSSSSTSYFPTQFESDFVPDEQLRRHPRLNVSVSEQSRKPAEVQNTGKSEPWQAGSPFNSLPPFNAARATLTGASEPIAHRRTFSSYTPSSSSGPSTPGGSKFTAKSSLLVDLNEDGYVSDDDFRSNHPPLTVATKADLSKPLLPHEGIARAIALFDFNAVQAGDLSFKKGQVIIVTQKSDDVNTWWSGKLEGREGIFPANFVEVV